MALDGDVLSHAVMPGAALGFVYSLHSLDRAQSRRLGERHHGGWTDRTAGARPAQPRHDAGLVAFYLVTLALGVTLVAFFGSNVDTVRVLFGTVLAINVTALLQIATVSSLTMLLLAMFYRPMAVDSFDPVFLRLVGGHGMRWLFIVLVLFNLVVSFQAFGTLMAIGPMLLPAAAARCWTNKPGRDDGRGVGGWDAVLLRRPAACHIIAICHRGQRSSWPPARCMVSRCWYPPPRASFEQEEWETIDETAVFVPLMALLRSASS